MLLAEVGLPLAAVREHVASALDLVVHVARDAAGRRQVVEVAEVLAPSAGSATLGSRRLADADAVLRTPTRGAREPAAGPPSPSWCRP